MEDLVDSRYDFQQLSSKYSYLSPFYRNGTFQFSYDGQCALSKAILQDEFNIDIGIKKGHLIPSIPSRKIYLSTINSVLVESNVQSSPIIGLDVGTGVYAIYAVLGSKMFNWKMIGCDLDEHAIKYSKELLKRNRIDEQEVNVVENDGIIDGEEFTFMCCNPPFYESKAEMLKNDEFKQDLRHEKVVASVNELVYEDGGEVGFIEKLVDQSVKTKKIIFYSSLIGQKKSIRPIIGKLDKVHCQNYFLREYQLGQTKRWIIFWSFQHYRPIVPNNYKNITPTIIEFPMNLLKLRPILSKLQLKIEDSESGTQLTIITNGDVWSRSFRRRGQSSNPQHKSIFIITPQSIHWQYGPSHKIFQSFHTFIKKCL